MASRMRSLHLHRREFLQSLIASGVGAFVLSSCTRSQHWVSPSLPTETGSGSVALPVNDATDALWNVLLPAELGPSGAVVSPGAREAGVDTVLDGENIVSILVSLGLVRGLSDTVVDLFDNFAASVRPLLNDGLDALATGEHPLAGFAKLDADAQARVVDRALADDKLGPILEAARAVAFLAYLGAVTNDAGLQAVGFPPFEDFANGLAVSGYPRQVNGATEDYTLNRAPQPTSGDDLSSIIGADGDLV
jgi:hypothetical protein